MLYVLHVGQENMQPEYFQELIKLSVLLLNSTIKGQRRNRDVKIQLAVELEAKKKLNTEAGE